MIVVNVDVMLARRKMSSGELAERVGITAANLSILKTGKAKAIRFSTLESLCAALDCQPGDLLEYRPDPEGFANLKMGRKFSCTPFFFYLCAEVCGVLHLQP